MIISRTPYRISLFGGGTDYPAWFNEHGGTCLGFAVDRFSWITLRKLPPFFPHRFRVVWSRIELVNHVSEIQHPAIRAVLEAENIRQGLEIHHDGDLPARSGLGSSSAFTVGLLNALHAMRGHHASRASLARDAISVERDILKENVGSQDQVWAAYGGFNHIVFERDGSWTVNPVLLDGGLKRELNESLMLVYTGKQRTASEIAGAQIANFGARETELKAIQSMVPDALRALQRGDILQIGRMLHETWRLKRGLAAGVSDPEIDNLYQSAMDAGAIGGKLIGAGGGGFMLLFVPGKARAKVQERLKGLVEVPFNIGAEGSRIVVLHSEEA